ncbi:tetratricopeptide repeat protein [Thermovibrio sp.]
MRRLFFSLFIFFLLTSSSLALDYGDIKKCYSDSYLYEAKGDYKRAIEALMPVYKAYPNGYTVNLRLGWLYYLLGKYSNSEYHYTKAIKVAPYSVEAKLGLTLPLIAQDRWSKVEETCYQILNTDYYNYYGNLRLSYALRNEGKFSLAEAIDRKMLTLYPTNVDFLLELALSLYGEGKYSSSKEVLKNILILSPNNKVAQEYLNKIEELEKSASSASN